MALKSPHVSPTKAPGEYFNILRVALICSPGEPVPRYEMSVGFYVNEEARRANVNPLHQYQVNIPFADLPEDPRVALYALLKQTPLFDDEVVEDALGESPVTLDIAKARKKDEITKAKIRANRTSFTFQGKEIQADEASMLEIQTTMAGVLARGALRDNWPGGWLAKDNSVIPILDVETWLAFYAAIEETGQANFDRSRALKMRVNAATTAEEVAAINWHTDLTLPSP